MSKTVGIKLKFGGLGLWFTMHYKH